MKRALKVLFTLAVFAGLLWLLCSVAMSGCSTVTEIMNGASYGEVFDAVHDDIFGVGSQICSTVEISLPSNSAYKAIDGKSCYESLTTDAQREAYKNIEKSIFSVTPNGGGKYGRYELTRASLPKLSSAEIFKVKEAVLCDHPEAFWVTGHYTLGSNMHDGSYIILYSAYSYDDIMKYSRQLERSVADALRKIPSGLSEFDRELRVHDYVVSSADYDVEAAEKVNDGFTEASTSYGVIVGKKGICGGYALATKLLLNRLGIECSVIKGVSKDTGHMWNIVTIEGEQYHLDVTWDDPINAGEGGSPDMISYFYFNLTDELISADHEIAGGYELLTDEVIAAQDEESLNFYNFPYGGCTSMKANYFEIFAVRLNELGKDAKSRVAKEMKERTVSGERVMYFMFPDEMENSVIESWLDPVLSSSWTAANKYAKSNGGHRIRSCTRSVFSEEGPKHWSRLYCVVLTFDK